MTHFALAALVLLGLASGALGAPPRPNHPISVSADSVMIAGETAIRFRSSQGGLSPAQRAEIVAERIQRQMERGVNPVTLRFRSERQNAVVTMGSAALFSITPQEAGAQNSMPHSLARLWADRLRFLLSTPLLTVSTTRLMVPLGESRALSFGGLLKEPLAVFISGQAASVEFTPGQRRAVVRGLSPGNARVTGYHDSVSLDVEVLVRPYAGRLPASAESFVTGTVAPAELIARTAQAAVRRSVSLEPGARVKVGDAGVRQGLRAGRRMQLSVPVRIEAPDAIPRSGRVPVTVHNVRLPPTEQPRLFYANDPEQVTGYGTLFLGRLEQGGPARLLYHYQNAMGRRFALTIAVVNPADEPVRLHITEGTAPPHPNPIVVGHGAARDFMENDRRGIGYITTLPPRSMITIVQHALRPSEVGSGLFALRQLDGGGRGYVQVKADDVNSPFVRPTPGGETLSSTIFGGATRAIAAHYEVGGRWTFIRLGSAPQRGPSRLTEEGFGDYGISYEIEVTLSNPTAHRQNVGLILEAASGHARGLFLIDGKVVETPTLKGHEEIVLAVYQLPAGGLRNVRISTLPLSGSAYPVRLVARDLPERYALRPGSIVPH